ncbi:MAG TPA: hypothetical protein VHU61_14985 [Solirubrobacteraceae bacterium]|jgi:hypothetical protein|nr:hypothetical protein [Solirubrobacteraceae bacterium]
MRAELDPEFAAALRGLLVERVDTSAGRRRRFRWPRTMGLRVGLVAAVIAAGGGVAAGTGLLSLWPPGGPVLTPLAAPVTVTGSGTQTISLGAQPAGANAIHLEFWCLTGGAFTFADGSSTDCQDAAGPSDVTSATLPLTAGQDSTVITAATGQRWRATATYVSATVSPWQTNASGQTYGVANQNGSPDLVDVIATNGRQGYAYAGQLQSPLATNPSQAATWDSRPDRIITVYKSDGKTPIGVFDDGK